MQENKIYRLRNNVIGFQIPIFLILFVLVLSEILEFYIFHTKIIYTDSFVPSSQLTIFTDLPLALRNQNAYFGFIFWILTTNYLRPFGYTVPEFFLFANILNKTIFVIVFITQLLFTIFDFFKVAYFGIVLISCSEYQFCRGRHYSGTPSLEMWFLFGTTIAHAVFGLVLLLLNIGMVKSLNPKVTDIKGVFVNSKMHYDNIRDSFIRDYGYYSDDDY